MSETTEILLVDDEPEILETIRRRLRLEDIAADLATDPIQAITMMQDNLYSIVISDIKMPHMSGAELLQELKKHNPLCNVIMMTGYSSMANVVDCLGSGALDYFVKPFQDIEEVVEAILQAKSRTKRWKQAIQQKTVETE